MNGLENSIYIVSYLCVRVCMPAGEETPIRHICEPRVFLFSTKDKAIDFLVEASKGLEGCRSRSYLEKLERFRGFTMNCHSETIKRESEEEWVNYRFKVHVTRKIDCNDNFGY